VRCRKTLKLIADGGDSGSKKYTSGYGVAFSRSEDVITFNLLHKDIL
jgi:hypothetical protein